MKTKIYNNSEKIALSNLSLVEWINFKPVTFNKYNFPCTIDSDAQAVIFTDLNNYAGHNEYFQINKFIPDVALQTVFTQTEADLINKIRTEISQLNKNLIGIPYKPSTSIIGQIGLFRIINAINNIISNGNMVVANDKKLNILEIGPGFGHLGCLLGLVGYNYCSTDITQSLYIYQNLLFEKIFSTNFYDPVFDDSITLKDKLQKFNNSNNSKIVHIPWWDWVEMYKNVTQYRNIDLIVANNNLGEMSKLSLRYNLKLSCKLLTNSNFGFFIFVNTGDRAISDLNYILNEFKICGFDLIIDEPFHLFVPKNKSFNKNILSLAKKIPLYDDNSSRSCLNLKDVLSLDHMSISQDMEFLKFCDLLEFPKSVVDFIKEY